MRLQIPITPFDNKLAFSQMEVAYTTLLNRPTASQITGENTILGNDNQEHPRIIRLAYHYHLILTNPLCHLCQPGWRPLDCTAYIAVLVQSLRAAHLSDTFWQVVFWALSQTWLLDSFLL